jgi:hypothetical protein
MPTPIEGDPRDPLHPAYLWQSDTLTIMMCRNAPSAPACFPPPPGGHLSHPRRTKGHTKGWFDRTKDTIEKAWKVGQKLVHAGRTAYKVGIVLCIAGSDGACKVVDGIEGAIETGISKLTDWLNPRASSSKRHTPGQSALIDMAKRDKHLGISTDDAQAYKQLGDEVGVEVRGPEAHPGRPYGKNPHIHVGPVDHIPVDDDNGP